MKLCSCCVEPGTNLSLQSQVQYTVYTVHTHSTTWPQYVVLMYLYVVVSRCWRLGGEEMWDSRYLCLHVNWIIKWSYFLKLGQNGASRTEMLHGCLCYIVPNESVSLPLPSWTLSTSNQRLRRCCLHQDQPHMEILRSLLSTEHVGEAFVPTVELTQTKSLHATWMNWISICWLCKNRSTYTFARKGR